MGDTSQQFFEYAGEKYKLVLEMIAGDGTITHSIDNNALEVLEFDSEFNKLFSQGTFIYNDTFGHFNRFLEKQETKLFLHFTRVTEFSDACVLIYNEDPDQTLVASFLVQNIEILSRENTCIKYRVHFISDNIYGCMSTIDYSNYGSAPESIFSIFKSCVKQVGLVVDDDSFNAVQTDVKLNYITSGNDNLYSVFKYLFNRLYYSGLRDTSIKFLLWDLFSKKYKLFDIRNKVMMNNNDRITLSLMKSDKETMIEPERIQLGSVVRFSQQDFVKSIFDAQMYEYDYNDNSFTKEKFSQKRILQFLNNKIDADPKLIVKQHESFCAPYEIKQIRRGQSWNNDFNFYGDFVRNISKNNALLVDVAGKMRRCPGYIMDINVDRSSTDIDGESIKQHEDYLQRFRGFEGSWMIYRVRHVIEFGNRRYRQKLTLMRNFTIDMVNVK